MKTIRMEWDTMNYFESKIKDYSCEFGLLDEFVNEKAEASNYFAWVREGYKTYFSMVDSLSESKFAIRYYRAKKLIYSAAQMLMEAKTSRNNECIVAYYFLAYYALFQAMQANLIICKAFDDEKVLQLSHDNIKKLFDAQFCQNNKCPIDSEIITLIEELRKNREYFSYAMPFNLTEDALIDLDKVEKWIGVCVQLFNLHCFIIWQDVQKVVRLDRACVDEIKEYFMQSCNRLKEDSFSDDADSDFWNEYKRDGCCEILPLSFAYDHDFDEFGTYDSEVYIKLGMPRTQRIISESLSFLGNIVGAL